MDPERRDAGSGGPAEERISGYRELGRIDGLAAVELLPEGDLDIESAEEFRRTFTRLLDSGVSHFFVNLGGVGYMDSTGLGSLMQLHRKAREAGGSVRFYDLRPEVREIFRLTHLDRIIDVDLTREAALSGIRENKGAGRG
ncbi:MAG: STAS domain-containing protein [Rubrobacter sp.]|nr:STAS domain-containing protein [Rubrobacter sp.]